MRVAFVENRFGCGRRPRYVVLLTLCVTLYSPRTQSEVVRCGHRLDAVHRLDARIGVTLSPCHLVTLSPCHLVKHIGRLTVKQLPRPGMLLTVISPPCAWAMAWAMLRPRP